MWGLCYPGECKAPSSIGCQPDSDTFLSPDKPKLHLYSHSLRGSLLPAPHTPLDLLATVVLWMNREGQQGRLEGDAWGQRLGVRRAP